MTSLVDFFGGTFVIFFNSIFEIIAVAWIYGIENFGWDVLFMTKKKLNGLWRICLAGITPVGLILIFLYSCVTFHYPTYSGKDFPTGLIGIISFQFFKNKHNPLFFLLQALVGLYLFLGPYKFLYGSLFIYSNK